MLHFINLSLISVYLFAPIYVGAANTPPPQNDQVLNQQPSNLKSWSSGIHLGLPELISFEGLYRYSPSWTIRTRLSPPVPLSIEVDEAPDSEQIESRLQVATPKQTVPLDVKYGPLFSIDTLYFPFEDSFFFGFGLTARWMQVHAEKSSEMYVCFYPDSILCTAEDASY